MGVAIANASNATPAGLEMLRQRAARFAALAEQPQPPRYAVGIERDRVTADDVAAAYAAAFAAEARAQLVDVAA